MKAFTAFVFALLICGAGNFAAAQIPAAPMKLTSTDFIDGGTIPKRFTCDDENVSPHLLVSGVPSAAKSLALIMDDPDAPRGTFTHWLVWNLAPDLKEIITNTVPADAIQGRNDFGKVAYGGPCPPSGEHRFYFRLYALDIPVKLPAGSSRKVLEKTMAGHIVGQAVLMGRYARSGISR